ncbi:MAG: Stp1/IreP family PP2C-type Ser/Thr phosphatase [Anaerolineae bacterium]|nr:Stp1/IreP family PP2C-type Ser/Thr phosphatase [Anaerolineae bacterium]
MPNPEQGIRLRSSARTSVGQVRENNEDNIHLWTRDDFVLAIVADGMGGAAAGEEASRIAVESIKLGFNIRENRGGDSYEDATLTEKLRDAIQSANSRIVEKAAVSPEMRGMGTTVTMAFVRGTYAIVAHVGDSRAYLVDGEDRTITQITSDHSFVEALLAAGHITQEQAEDHPMRNVLYRALGQAEDIDVDMYYKRLHVGDRMVLCSDGLTRHVKPDEIAKLALSDPNPDVASQKMIDLANERGGEDNVSVIVISVEENTNGTPPESEEALTEDEDETLILKGRARPGLTDLDDLLPKLETDTVQVHKVPPAPPVSNGEVALDDAKMTAERLKDSGEVIEEDVTEDSSPVQSDEPIDQVIARRPPTLPDPLPPPMPMIEERESQGEGRDTMMPDQ